MPGIGGGDWAKYICLVLPQKLTEYQSSDDRDSGGNVVETGQKESSHLDRRASTKQTLFMSDCWNSHLYLLPGHGHECDGVAERGRSCNVSAQPAYSYTRIPNCMSEAQPCPRPSGATGLGQEGKASTYGVGKRRKGRRDSARGYGWAKVSAAKPWLTASSKWLVFAHRLRH